MIVFLELLLTAVVLAFLFTWNTAPAFAALDVLLVIGLCAVLWALHDIEESGHGTQSR